MPSIFSPAVGAVTKVSGGSSESVFKIAFGGGTTRDGFFTSGTKLTAPVTGFAFEQNSNYQFLHTMNDFIYVYNFGDRIGELVVSGIGFAKTCPSASGAQLCGVMQFYNENKLSNVGDLSLQLGDCSPPFFAFLTGMRMELQDPRTLVAQWTLRFNIVPKRARTGWRGFFLGGYEGESVIFDERS